MKAFSFWSLPTLLAAVLSLLATLHSHAQVESYQLTPLWSIPAESPGYEWISTNHTQRGLAYNPATDHLLTVSRYPATSAAVYILDRSNGAHIGNLDVTGVYSEINFPLNMIGVAEDGVIFACNLTVDSTNAPTGNNGPFRIYRWANESAIPTVAYLGDPSNADPALANRRFGDSLAVRGSGANTEILVGTRSARSVTRFVTTDGLTFTAQKLDAPELPGVPNTMTISFGDGNTFWTKTQSSPSTNHPLLKFSYDTASGTATVIQSYTNGVPVGGPLGIQGNMLGMIDTLKHEFRLYRLTSSGAVAQDISYAFGTNSNGNNTGSVAFADDGSVYALESNNGIQAFQITTNAFSPFETSVATDLHQVTLNWPSQTGIGYQVQSKESLNDPVWTRLVTTNGTGGTISIVDTPAHRTRFYRIQAE